MCFSFRIDKKCNPDEPALIILQTLWPVLFWCLYIPGSTLPVHNKTVKMYEGHKTIGYIMNFSRARF